MATSSQLIIKSYTPFKYWLKVILVSIGLVCLSWLAFALGYYRSGYDNVDLRQNRDAFVQRIDELERFNTVLREKNVVLEQSKRIDSAAMTNVDTSFKELQTEILELKEEVAFYRAIVSPSDADDGLDIASLEVHPIDANTPGGFRFKLVLTNMKPDKRRIIKGIGQLSVTGLQDGTQSELSLAQLSNQSVKKLTLRFKHFQTLEGDLVLPSGFTPSSVIIDIKPDANDWSRIKKNFDWADIQK